MCNVCGCDEGETQVAGVALAHHHNHMHDHAHHAHDHSHEHSHDHHHDHGIDFGNNPAGVSVAGMDSTRLIRIEQDVLAKNNAYAKANRADYQQHGIFVLNLMSSPGAGKTTLLEQTILLQKDRYPDTSVAVIEGDQQTDNDARRIRETGAKALQINTGKGCHLDAHMVGHANRALTLADNSILFIENVGNLVCPAAFDLGEAHKVVVLSVTEGDDKPLKYPDMFRAARVMVMNKCDLLPYVKFSVETAIDNAKKINPLLRVFQLSATNGEGMNDWVDWINRRED